MKDTKPGLAVSNSANRITVITGLWPSKVNPISGIFVAEHVASLVSLGHEVTVVCVQINNKVEILSLQDLNLGDRPCAIRTIQVRQLPSLFGAISAFHSLFVTSYSLGRQIKKRGYCSPGDIILVHGQVPLGFGRAVWPAELRRNPTAIVIHGESKFLSKPGVSAVVKLANHFGITNNVAIAPVGKTLLPSLRTLGIPSNLTTVVGNGTRYANLTYRNLKPNEPIRILSVANLHHEKGVDTLIIALSQLLDKNWRLDVIGDGPEKNTLVKTANTLLGSDRVKFHGRIDRNETLEFFDNCQIFCLPSKRESFGLVFLEAQMRGIPTIGCIDTGAEEIINDAKTGFLIQQNDYEGLARRLSELIGDSLLREKISEDSRKSALTKTWDSYNQKILDLLQVN